MRAQENMTMALESERSLALNSRDNVCKVMVREATGQILQTVHILVGFKNWEIVEGKG